MPTTHDVIAIMLDNIAIVLTRTASALREVTPASAVEIPAPEPQRDLITTEEFAELVRCAPQTPRKWRVNGSGPPYLRVAGRILYRRDDVEDWLTERRYRHTSHETVSRRDGES
jgi:hypothetical protein